MFLIIYYSLWDNFTAYERHHRHLFYLHVLLFHLLDCRPCCLLLLLLIITVLLLDSIFLEGPHNAGLVGYKAQ